MTRRARPSQMMLLLPLNPARDAQGNDQTHGLFADRDEAPCSTRLPEEAKDITAVYVNDMGRVQNWQQPEPGTWTEARDAWFVIGSARRGRPPP